MSAREERLVVPPQKLEAYLRRMRWVQRESHEGRVAIWERDDQPYGFEVLVPFNHAASDYRALLRQAVEVLAIQENRDVADVVEDAATASNDLIELVVDTDSVEPTIPLDQGSALVDHARDLLLAAASSTVEPRPWFGPRRAAVAEEFIRATRLGQSKRGSYVVTIIAPTPAEEEGLFAEVVSPLDSFERRAVDTLARSLRTAREAANRVHADNDLGGFLDGVEDGVSANLCTAMAGLVAPEAESRAVEVRVSWAMFGEDDWREDVAVALDAEDEPVFRLAAEALRADQRIDYRVRGPVVRLARRRPHRPGQVIVEGEVDGATRNIWISLDQADYERAIRAHQQGEGVGAVGDLHRTGRHWELTNLTEFTTEPVQRFE